MKLSHRDRKIAAMGIGVLVVLSAFGLLVSGGTATDSGKLTVVASFYPLYYFASEIGKDDADVRMLIPDNAEPHSWEPSPSDLIKVNNADLLIYNGEGFEPWMSNFISSSSNPSLVLVDTSKNVSMKMTGEVQAVYEQAVQHLDENAYASINASASAAAAPTISISEGKLTVQLASYQGGNGGVFKVTVAEGGDDRLFLTDGSFNIGSPSGEVTTDLEVGEITWYPQFSAAKFVELKAGTSYQIEITGANSTSTNLMIVQAPSGSSVEAKEHGLIDPHFWLDPINAKVQVNNILAGFIEADPGNTTYYKENAQDLLSRLDALDQEYVSGLANRTKNVIVTTHEGFDYLAERYGFTAYGAIGISADSQPSAQDLASLSQTIKTLGLKYVFAEPIYSDAVIETIAGEANVQVLVLDGIHGRTGLHAHMDYFEIMRANLQQLKIGLEVVS